MIEFYRRFLIKNDDKIKNIYLLLTNVFKMCIMLKVDRKSFIRFVRVVSGSLCTTSFLRTV